MRERVVSRKTCKKDLRKSLVRSLAWSIFSPRTGDSHCDRIPFSPLSVVSKIVMWESRALVKRTPGTGSRNITEILLKMAPNTIQSFNQLVMIFSKFLANQCLTLSQTSPGFNVSTVQVF